MDLIDLPELPGNASPDRGIHAMRAMERRALIVRDMDPMGKLLTNRQVLRAWASDIAKLNDVAEGTTLAPVSLSSLNDVLLEPSATLPAQPLHQLQMKLTALPPATWSALELALDAVGAMYGSEPQPFPATQFGVRLVLSRHEGKAAEVGTGPLLCVCNPNKHESALPPAADGGTCLDCSGTYRCA